MEKILELKNLKKHYPILGGVFRHEVSTVKALDGIDLDIYRGECLGIVGESGCGKTTTGKAIVRLHDPTSGQVYYYGKGQTEGNPVDVAQTKKSTLKKLGIRAKLQMVFQDPSTSLNPRMLVKNIIAEPIKTQERLGSRVLEERVLALLGDRVKETGALLISTRAMAAQPSAVYFASAWIKNRVALDPRSGALLWSEPVGRGTLPSRMPRMRWKYSS